MGINVSNPDIDSDATTIALSGLNATPGMVVQTGADAFTKRTLTASGSNISIADGAGTSGNPTISLAAVLQNTTASFTTADESKLDGIEAGADVTDAANVADAGAVMTSGLGTGVATALGANVGSAGAPVVNGGALGTPSSATLTNATGLPVGTGISGLGSNWTSALGAALPSPWAAYLAKSPSGSGGFYSNHATLDGGRQNAVVWGWNDRVMMGDAVDDDLTAPMSWVMLTGITRSGSTATATSSGPHGFSTSDSIKITGAAQSDYNITATITVTSSTTFTFAVANSPTTPATTISVFQAAKVTATTTATEAWLETFRRTSVRAAQVAIISKEGQLGLTVASRTSDWPFSNSESSVGINVYGINNNVSQVQAAWAGYFEGVRYAGAGITHAIEVESVNFGTEVTADLHDIHPDYTSVSLWAASGGGYYGTNAATAALAVTDNGATYINGIICEATALDGCDGAGSGAASFMRIACGHRLDWEYASNTLGSRIWSAVTSATNALAQKFTNTGFELTSLDDATQYYQLGKSAFKTRSDTGIWVGSGMGSLSQEATYTGALRLFNNGGVAGGGGLEFHNPFFGSGYGFRLIAPDLGGGATPLIFQRRSNSASWGEGVRLTASGGFVIPRLSADPTAEDNGELYYNTSTGKIRGRAGGSWVDLH